jgi:hypothetical protein
MLRPEAVRQQLAERESPSHLLHVSGDHRYGVGRKLPQLLPAAAAGCYRLRTLSHDDDSSNSFSASSHKMRQSACFGT